MMFNSLSTAVFAVELWSARTFSTTARCFPISYAKPNSEP